MSSERDLARYYDRNTPRFLLVGGGGGSHSIHRQLWGPGVTSVEAASRYIDRLIEDEIRGLAPPEGPSVLDLGCGVGGTLFHLAEAFQRGRFRGITISPRQHRIAMDLARRKGLENRCQFLLGDFERMALGEPADAVVAIESFVHSESLERFLRTASGHLRQGGRLLVADDFLTEEVSGLDPSAHRRIEDFQAGWRVPSLCTVEAFAAEADRRQLELERSLDLTGLIRLGRPRDRLIALVTPLFRRLRLAPIPFFGNMIGGDALQIGLREGFLGYRLLVLRKSGT